MERKPVFLGIDLGKIHTQISVMKEAGREPKSISDAAGNLFLDTPEDFFAQTEASEEQGAPVLAEYLNNCIQLAVPGLEMEKVCLMLTLGRIRPAFVRSYRRACRDLGIPKGRAFIQTYRESYFSYVMHQKKELFSKSVLLLNYEEAQITPYLLRTSKETRPSLASVAALSPCRFEPKRGRTEKEWNVCRDEVLLEMLQKLLAEEEVSSAFLIGDAFSKDWAEQSLEFLCRRRKVFYGQNLFTKGACFRAADRASGSSAVNGYLFESSDMVTMNVYLDMEKNGRRLRHRLISAGTGWFEAADEFDLLTENTEELNFIGIPLRKEEEECIYTIPLTGIPKRKGKTVRLSVRAECISAHQCRITVKDQGFGELFPSSCMVWESRLEL